MPSSKSSSSSALARVSVKKADHDEYDGDGLELGDGKAKENMGQAQRLREKLRGQLAGKRDHEYTALSNKVGGGKDWNTEEDDTLSPLQSRIGEKGKSEERK